MNYPTQLFIIFALAMLIVAWKIITAAKVETKKEQEGHMRTTDAGPPTGVTTGNDVRPTPVSKTS